MKKLIAVIMVLIIFCSTVGCTKQTSENDINEKGYIIIDHQYFDCGIYSVSLVYDVRTKIQYLMSFDSYGIGFCPYYDSDGNVAFYDGK